MTKTATTDHRTASDALGDKCREIDALLHRIQSARADHFGVDWKRSGPTWSHVGTATHVADLLKSVAEFVDA